MKKILAPIIAGPWKHQWALVGSLATIAFILGLAGLYKLKVQTGRLDQLSWPDAIYFSLRLFGFNYDLGGGGPDPYAAGNWQLWVARFLAPASTALAVFKAVASSAASRVERWRISRWKDHAIVCGAGERGHHLALSLRKQGKNVVVIDKQEDIDTLNELRTHGVLTIRGNATEPEILAAANVERAEVVVALTPSVEANLEVVLAASRRTNGTPGQAFAYAPRSFASIFEGQEPFRRDESDVTKQSLKCGFFRSLISVLWETTSDVRKQSVECGFFNHNATAARVLVREHAPDLGPTLFREQRGARILVAGDGEILPELLGVLIAQCQFTGPYLPRITLLTVDKETIAQGFPIDHPQMTLVVDLKTEPMSISQMLRVSVESLATQPFDLVFVACREDGDTLTVATNLAQQETLVRNNVIAGLAPSTRLKQKVDQCFKNTQPIESVTLYNLLTLGCEASHVVQPVLDDRAREMHKQYFEKQQQNGEKKGSSMAMHPWEALRGDFRESNRSAADHIAIKTRILQLSQSQQTIELLAEAEHRRWMAQRIVSGWRHADKREDKKRLTPNFVPYADLSDREREKDRNNVRDAIAGR